MLRMKQSKRIHKMHHSNGGFSLVELVIVIAIITVVTSSAIIGFQVLNSGNAAKAAKTMSGEIEKLRTNTLSKEGKWCFEIENDSGRYIGTMYCWTVDENGVDQVRTEESVKLGSRIEITGWESGKEAVKDNIAPGKKLVIAYERGSGKIAGIKISDIDVVEKPSFPAESGAKGPYYAIAAGKHHGNEESFAIFYETGKVVTDYQNW